MTILPLTYGLIPLFPFVAIKSMNDILFSEEFRVNDEPLHGPEIKWQAHIPD